MAQQPLVGQCLIIEASRSYSDTTQSVLLPWTSDQPYALTPLPAQRTDIHAPGGIRTRNLGRRAAADPRLRPRGHWDRYQRYLWHGIYSIVCYGILLKLDFYPI